MRHHNPFFPRFDELSPLAGDRVGEGLCDDLSRAAAVLVILAGAEDDLEIIYTRRADHLLSHAGQVSFPGGRWEPEDANLAITALRETEEEIGLGRSQVNLLGTLDARRSKYGLEVLPYVGRLEVDVPLVPNPDEIASLFRVPLRYFMQTRPDRVDLLDRHGVRIAAPAWDFEGYDIWGLTAVFTQDLLRRLGIGIDLKGVPREKRGSGDDR